MPMSVEERRRRHRERYHAMTEEQRADYFLKRKLRRRANPDKEKQHSKKWRQKNLHITRASGVDNNVAKRYPETFACSRLTRNELALWIKEKMEIGATCPYCNRPANSVDHVTPLSRGGLHEIRNLEYVCLTCNKAKNDSTKEEFLAWIAALVGNYELGVN